MSIPYHDILADVALRVNAIKGVTPDLLETAYKVRPLTPTQFNSAIYPFSAIISAMSLAEQKLAEVMASTSNPVLRAPLHALTPSIPSGGEVPVGDSSINRLIGILGAVRDSTDFLECTEKTLEEIIRRNRNAGGYYRLPMYAYKFDGVRIIHTRQAVVIDCCVYNRETQLAAMEINDPMLLADSFGEAMVCGAIASLMRDDEDAGQAQVYASYFNDTLKGIAQGLLPVVSKVTPGPTMTATST